MLVVWSWFLRLGRGFLRRRGGCFVGGLSAGLGVVSLREGERGKCVIWTLSLGMAFRLRSKSTPARGVSRNQRTLHHRSRSPLPQSSHRCRSSCISPDPDHDFPMRGSQAGTVHDDLPLMDGLVAQSTSTPARSSIYTTTHPTSHTAKPSTKACVRMFPQTIMRTQTRQDEYRSIAI